MSADECYCAVEPWPGCAWPDPCDYCMRKAKEHDARPDDMAALRAQLADAMKVVEAVRVLDVHNGNSIVRLADALRDYDAKHGAK